MKTVHFFGWMIAAQLVAGGVGGAELQRDYAPLAVLSPAQEKIVIGLARKAGVDRIEKIYTYGLHPGPAHQIGVKSVETIEGRRVRFRVVHLGFKDWTSALDRPRENSLVLRKAMRFEGIR